MYTHLGYNLKPLEIQAAIGIEQLKKVDMFIEARKNNWNKLRIGLACLEDIISFSNQHMLWSGKKISIYGTIQDVRLKIRGSVL